MDATRNETRRTLGAAVAVVVLLGLGVIVGRCSAPTAAAVEITPADYENVAWDYNAATASAIHDLDVWIQSTTTTTTVARRAPVVSHAEQVSSTGVFTPDEAAFFTCVRWRESRNDYTVVNSTGTFRGAYQWYQGGWDNYAAQVAPDWVGVPPNEAPPAIQDLVSVTAYRQIGARPWGGACS